MACQLTASNQLHIYICNVAMQLALLEERRARQFHSIRLVLTFASSDHECRSSFVAHEHRTIANYGCHFRKKKQKRKSTYIRINI